MEVACQTFAHHSLHKPKCYNAQEAPQLELKESAKRVPPKCCIKNFCLNTAPIESMLTYYQYF